MHSQFIRGNQLTQKYRFTQFFSLVGVFLVLIGALSVFANNAYYLLQGHVSLSLLLFCLSFALAVFWPAQAFIFTIACLPLVGNLSQELGLILGINLLTWVNPGLDLVAGCYLGWMVNQGQRQSCVQCIKRSEVSMPWPVGLLLSWVLLSATLAIARNITQSAARTDLKGALFNLVNFRPMGWHDDYYPINDFIAYSLACGLVMLTVAHLTNFKNRDAIVFRPLMLGLFIAALAGLVQSQFGYGLPDTLKEFRRDVFGYAVIGLQPDLHAYAGHMLLGALGLWGYFQVINSRRETWWILFIIVISWMGVVLSKSRSTLLIAIAVGVASFIFIWVRDHRSLRRLLVIVALILLASLLAWTEGFLGNGAFLGWSSELANQLRSKDVLNFNQLGGIMGSRFEIWSAAIRMIEAFPMVGIGQGEFYRLSADVSFSKSHFLFLNHGENAHNYFLQTLAELGFIGMMLFGLVLLYPFKKISSKQHLIPAMIGLGSLFLGNIFSHAFLVRENLLLAAVLLGLSYAWLAATPKKDTAILRHSSEGVDKGVKNNHLFLTNTKWIGAVVLMVILGGLEVVYSWHKLPFSPGVLCQKALPLSDDGWSSGAYELVLPSGVRGVKLPIQIERPKLNQYPLEVRIALFNSKQFDVPVQVKRYNTRSSDVIDLVLPNEGIIAEGNVKMRLDLSSCYTPRNLGVNNDARKLGMIIGEPQFLR